MAALPLLFAGHSRDVSSGDAPSLSLARVDAMSDRRLDRATLVEMYETLAPRVHRFLRDLLGDAALATDATQETFVRAFRRLDARELPDDTRLVPWVFGVARFVAIEMRKTRAKARRLIDDHAEADENTADTRTRTPEAELLDREAVRVVERALAQLPEDKCTALLLRCDHGLAYDEIAKILGWSLPKVKIEIFRAREVLRALLAENEERNFGGGK